MTTNRRRTGAEKRRKATTKLTTRSGLEKGDVFLSLHGGPKDGETVTYSTPYPKVLVITEVTKSGIFYHDYRKRGEQPGIRNHYDWIDTESKGIEANSAEASMESQEGREE